MSDHVSIRPNVGMLSLFPHMKYEPWYAIGELVDNSIQSYVANRDRLHELATPEEPFRLEIVIETSTADTGRIVVRDNAAGIDKVNVQRAFRVAEPPPDASGLSQFGVGMKAASAWFAKEFEVRSTALGESVIRTVRFDIPAIVASRSEELDVLEEPTDWDTHWTEVTLWNLNRVPQRRTLGKMKEHLGSIYREFLRNGDVVITFDGSPLSYADVPVLEAPRWDDTSGPAIQWRKTVDIRLESGRRVTGWAAIRAKGQASQSGFALLYRRKVVQGAGADVYKPEDVFGGSNRFRSQRLFGELVMDDFAVTYTKDSLVWHDEEQEFLGLLRPHLDAEPMPVLRQAESYRAREVAPLPADTVTDVIDKVAGLFPNQDDFADLETFAGPGAADLNEADSEVIATRVPSASFEPIVRDFQVRVHHRVWNVRLSLVAEEAIGDWLGVTRTDDAGESTVTVTVNQAHPFMRNFAEVPSQDLEPVWRLAVALGLGVQLAKDGGNEAGLVLLKVNSLLRKYLAHQS